MSYYHIIIATERRTQPERMATVITSEAGEMLHTLGAFPGDIDDPQFVMVAEWDCKSPFVIVHKGDYNARNMHYDGWPSITQQEWINEQNPGDEYL
jgi:NAD(P)H-hydrate repair Nnr-like enzyme with NAD(P)H-hydrate dehydratase domain